MLMVKMLEGKAIEARNLGEVPNEELPKWVGRWDWNSMAEVERIAHELNEAANKVIYLNGARKPFYMAADAGPGVSPRYDVFSPPRMGDDVSYSFNGDSYPDGHVVSVSPNYRVIVTSTGNRYYRVKQSAGWRRNGTWWLVAGHISERNPHI